ncbi:alkaline phosphatase family protein [Hydrotalea sp.]|uniref:alkaline phosphatase family protein n=1 Tax=Hydrotalea sp. TaxID=2881279 RepID=UPI003D106F24
MKIYKVFFCCIMCCFWGFRAADAQPQHKVLFVIADGIPADMIENMNIPALQKIIDSGTYLRSFTGGILQTYSQMPTISAPGYNNLLTGTWAYKHNVFSNNVQNPNYHYKHILRLLKDQYPQKKVAVFSSWLDNRTKLLGDGLPQAGDYTTDFYFDGFELDTLHFPHDAAHSYMHRIDEMVIHKADSVIKKNGPDASWIYLEYTDDMGHMHGTNSTDYHNALTYFDAQMNKIWQAVQYREKNFNEKWLVVITTDHGRDAQTGRNHGGQSERERTTWMILNTKKLNNYAHKDEPAVVDIYPTIARFMHVSIPTSLQYELDGVPLIGAVSVAKPSVVLKSNSLQLQWQALEDSGTVKIYAATTNQFKTGGTDHYTLIATVPNQQQSFELPLPKEQTAVLKLVIQGAHNCVNTWYTASNTTSAK